MQKPLSGKKQAICKIIILNYTQSDDGGYRQGVISGIPLYVKLFIQVVDRVKTTIRGYFTLEGKYGS